MNPDQTKTLSDLLKSGIDSVNAFWSLYSAVAFALLGYVFAAQRPVQLLIVRIILVVVFGVFAFSNWYSLIREQRKALTVSNYVIGEFRKHPEMNTLADSLNENAPSEASMVTAFHVFLDLSIITIVFLAPSITHRSDGQGD